MIEVVGTIFFRDNDQNIKKRNNSHILKKLEKANHSNQNENS